MMNDELGMMNCHRRHRSHRGHRRHRRQRKFWIM